MVKFQKNYPVVFAHTKKRDAGQNLGATKIPFPIRAGDENPLLITHSSLSRWLQTLY